MKKKVIILFGLILSVGLIFMACSSPTVVETSDDSSVEEVVVVSDEIAAAELDSCTDCHNDTTLIVSKEVQWENSLHGSGLTFERNGADCAGCHTSEGYTERITAGTFTASEDVENPSPINCRTCHSIHDTYTSADWTLTSSEPVTFELTGDTYDLGNSNQCATCHQPRPADVPLVDGGDYEITSTRFGPHHGPQSSMIAGVGGYGEEYVGSNIHYEYVDDGCIGCHMTDTAYGKQAGGHSFNVTYEYHEETVEYLTGCIVCHEDIESFDRNGVQTEIEELLEEVHVLLVAQGLIDGESGSGIAGTFTSDQAGALWNYKTVEEDRSMGIHNPGYTKFLLETALEALE
ncbi:MAG: cytochrome c family protein [Actinobacteria bacterium]|nr:cytochrome c family protein [Actinomycetota bacterium]